MSLNFPTNPRLGDTYTYKNTTYIWNGVGWAPTAVPTPNDSPVFVSDCPPNNPHQGDLWYQATTGTLWMYYVDLNGSQWVTVMPLPDGVLTTTGNQVVQGPLYFEAPIQSDLQPVTLGYFNQHTISDLGGTVQGPLFLTFPIDPAQTNQAITVGYVRDVLRTGNGITATPTTGQVQGIDAGVFFP